MSRRLLALLILATTLPCLAKSKPVTVGVAPVEAGSRAPASVATVVQNALEEELALPGRTTARSYQQPGQGSRSHWLSLRPFGTLAAVITVASLHQSLPDDMNDDLAGSVREAAVRQDLRSLLAVRLTPGRVRLAGLAATVT